MKEDAYHYGVIQRAIEHIDREGPQSLDALASEAGMSEAHFQRVFSAWAGISPKRFGQYLTLGHAKRLLDKGESLPETSEKIRLSGTSRLYDLFIRWEAMTPGEYANKGNGLNISFGSFASPFGKAIAMGTERGLCALGFTGEKTHEEIMQDFMSRWPKASYHETPERIEPWVRAALSGMGEAPLHLLGRPFQIKVWEALLSIPPGKVSSYGALAKQVGYPKAARAVGSAIGQNPIGLLIPCHRAIRSTGGLGGYHWGLPVKRAMLAWEYAQSEAQKEKAAALST